MLRVLLKNDIKNFWDKVSMLWLVFLVSSISIIFFVPFISYKGDYISAITIATYIFSTAGFYLSPLLIAIAYFRKSMYGTEGYLTHSIPAKTSIIVLSKLITIAIFTLIGEILASYVLLYLPRYFLFIEGGLIFFTSPVQHLYGISFSEIMIQFLIPVYLGTTTFTLMILFSQTVAQMVNKSSKSLITALLFILIYFVATLLTLLLMDYDASKSSNVIQVGATHLNYGHFDKLYISQIVFYISQILILSAATIIINAKRLKI